MMGVATEKRRVGEAGVPGEVGRWRPAWGRLRAVEFKEARELAAVVVVCWVVLGVMVGFFLGLMPWYVGASLSQGWGAMDGTVLQLFPMGCLAAGFAFGTKGYRGQKGFDAWAFWVHRPETRGRLFGMKSAAGLGLYAVTAGVPAVAWLAWAGSDWRWTPVWSWRFVLPYAADMGLGVAGFFAGALLVQRQARWWGTKLLPGLAVVPVMAADVGATHLWQAALAEAVGIGLLAAAGWDAAWTHGEHDSGKRWRKGVLIGVMTVGCISGWMALGALAEEVEQAGQAGGPEWYSVNWTVPRWMEVRLPVVSSEGEVVMKVRRVQIGWHRGEAPEIYYETLEGKRLAPEVREMAYWGGARVNRQRFLEEHGGYRDGSSIVEHATETEVEERGPAKRQSGKTRRYVTWYYLPAERVVRGYEWPGHRYAGTVGPSGRHAAGDAEEPFTEPAARAGRLIDGMYVRSLLGVDHWEAFPGRPDARVSRVEVMVQDAGEPQPQATPLKEVGFLYVMEKQVGVWIWDPPRRVVELPLRAGENDERSLQVRARADGKGYVLIYSGKPFEGYAFELYDEGGRLEREVKVAGQPRWREWKGARVAVVAEEMPGTVAARVGSGMVLGVAPMMAAANAWREAPEAWVVGMEQARWTGMGMMELLGVLGMLVVSRWYGVTGWRRWAWAGYAAVLGVLMVVVFVAVERWPGKQAVKAKVTA